MAKNEEVGIGNVLNLSWLIEKYENRNGQMEWTEVALIRSRIDATVLMEKWAGEGARLSATMVVGPLGTFRVSEVEKTVTYKKTPMFLKGVVKRHIFGT